MLTLHGTWARERHIQQEDRSVMENRWSSSTKRRIQSSGSSVPGTGNVRNTTQEMGEVYAMHFVYSGNFPGAGRGVTSLTASACQWESILRNFCWNLRAGRGFPGTGGCYGIFLTGAGWHDKQLFHHLYTETI